ncbi:hypothetical protein C8F04DRAFT_1274765 [Mycena alexandri]|uniref:Uncharacterized protein n=1 Tax=Mycena alexandri TaxID=1745969 RepID=A0AAD6WR65_9AGAR|nr:hypothetical protein C8F04DRAFT_1274765 [Mycena alexandri]
MSLVRVALRRQALQPFFRAWGALVPAHGERGPHRGWWMGRVFVSKARYTVASGASAPGASYSLACAAGEQPLFMRLRLLLHPPRLCCIFFIFLDFSVHIVARAFY